VYASAHAA